MAGAPAGSCREDTRGTDRENSRDISVASWRRWILMCLRFGQQYISSQLHHPTKHPEVPDWGNRRTAVSRGSCEDFCYAGALGPRLSTGNRKYITSVHLSSRIYSFADVMLMPFMLGKLFHHLFSVFPIPDDMDVMACYDM